MLEMRSYKQTRVSVRGCTMETTQTKGRIYSWPCQPGLLQMQHKHGMTSVRILDTTSKVVNSVMVQATLHRSVAILFQQTYKRIQQYLTNTNATNLHKVEQYIPHSI